MKEGHPYLAQLCCRRQMSLQLPCSILPHDGTAVHSNQPVIQRGKEGGREGGRERERKRDKERERERGREGGRERGREREKRRKEGE